MAKSFPRPRARSFCNFAVSISGKTEPAAQRVVVRSEAFDFPGHGFGIGEVRDADGAPPDFVFVGWADAAAPWCRSAPAPAALFARGVEVLVKRQDQAAS